MAASMLGSVTSLHYVVAVLLHRVAFFTYLKIIILKKNSSLKQHFHIVIVHGVEKTQPVEPVEPVVRCCNARIEAIDPLYNHGFATG